MNEKYDIIYFDEGEPNTPSDICYYCPAILFNMNLGMQGFDSINTDF